MSKVTLVWPGRARYEALTEEKLQQIVFAVWPAWVRVKTDGKLYPAEKNGDLIDICGEINLTLASFDALKTFYAEYIWGPTQRSLVIIGETEALDTDSCIVDWVLCNECFANIDIPLSAWIDGVLEIKDEFTDWVIHICNLMRGTEGRTLN